MPEYKVTYFNAAAVGEPIRWILRYAKVPFEDDRINQEDWPKEKHRFPSGQVPMVVENGQQLTQSGAIVRYLGKKYGLVTGNDFLDFRVDQVVELVNDGRNKWRTYQFESDAGKKAELLKDLTSTHFPVVLKQLNDIVKESSSGPFIAGSKVTYGDFCLTNWLQIWVKTTSADLLKDYPALTGQVAAVIELPEIKKWLEERPKTFL